MQENKDSVSAMVVTYNRCEILKECIAALLNQTHPLTHLIIIDNHSTDGTAGILSDKALPFERTKVDSDSEHWEAVKANVHIRFVRMSRNIGGSGGFNLGIKLAEATSAQWVWVMDDDTIVRPDSLQHLLSSGAQVKEPIGFKCSRVLWNNGDFHKMNIPIVSAFVNNLPFCQYKDVSIVKSCSFVSVLVNTKAIEKCGYPIKEFFIWGDDSEYTSRITDNGFLGLYCPQSEVLHKTATNYSANILEDTAPNAWKYSYGIRNDLYLVKRKGFVKYFFRLLKYVLIKPWSIYRKRKTDKMLFVRTHLKASLSSVPFNPRVEWGKGKH